MMRSMAPQVMAIDELGGEEDAQALLHVIRCGITILVTIHGDSIEEIREKRFLKEYMEEEIFQRYIVLSRDMEQFRVKEILNGEFQIC